MCVYQCDICASLVCVLVCVFHIVISVPVSFLVCVLVCVFNSVISVPLSFLLQRNQYMCHVNIASVDHAGKGTLFRPPPPLPFTPYKNVLLALILLINISLILVISNKIKNSIYWFWSRCNKWFFNSGYKLNNSIYWFISNVYLSSCYNPQIQKMHKCSHTDI